MTTAGMPLPEPPPAASDEPPQNESEPSVAAVIDEDLDTRDDPSIETGL